jgi:hypothetical protein
MNKFKAIGLIAIGLVIVYSIGCCGKQEPQQDNKVKVEARINGISSSWVNGDKTYLTDSHGHKDSVHGIWGKVGDTVTVTCINGVLWID